MSDMEETEGTEGPVAPHRVIGTPPPSPRLLGSTAVAEHREPAPAADEEAVGDRTSSACRRTTRR